MYACAKLPVLDGSMYLFGWGLLCFALFYFLRLTTHFQEIALSCQLIRCFPLFSSSTRPRAATELSELVNKSEVNKRA